MSWATLYNIRKQHKNYNSILSSLLQPKDSHFKIIEQEVEVPAENRMEISIFCTLIDRGKFIEHLCVKIEHGDEICLTVRGDGIGHSLLFEPQLDPEYDVGSIFTYHEHRYPILVKNLGHIHYKIKWTRRAYAKAKIKGVRDLTDDGVTS